MSLATVSGRPSLRQTVQQHDAAAAGDLKGAKTQVVADAATAGIAVACDPEADMYVSEEATSAHAFTGLALGADIAPIARTFKRQGSVAITVTLDAKIDGSTSYTLDAAGSAITLVPYHNAAGAGVWALQSAVGAVTAVA